MKDLAAWWMYIEKTKCICRIQQDIAVRRMNVGGETDYAGVIGTDFRKVSSTKDEKTKDGIYRYVN